MMSGCCMRHVTDASSKSRMFCFPADAVRRRLWTQNCRRLRPYFEPKAWHRLCEKHFDEAQFESHRADGLRKLRPDAVPTKFSVPISLPPKKQQHGPEIQDEHMYSKKPCTNDAVSENPPSPESLSSDIKPTVDILPGDFVADDDVDSLDVDSETDLRDASVLGVGGETSDKPSQEEVEHQLRLEIRRLKWKLRQSNKREARLTANITRFLNADQLEKLSRSAVNTGSSIIWSSSTIQRCLAILSVVGRGGYRYLCSLNFPLPSYRTLCRHIRSNSPVPTIQQDVSELSN